MRKILVSIAVIILCGCNSKDEFIPTYELLDFHSSSGTEIIKYYVYIKDYEDKYFNKIPFQKYINDFYYKTKFKNDYFRYFRGVTFVKSDKEFKKEYDEDIFYKDYKDDIIIEFHLDIEAQKSQNKLVVNNVKYMDNGVEKNIGLFLFQ